MERAERRGGTPQTYRTGAQLRVSDFPVALTIARTFRHNESLTVTGPWRTPLVSADDDPFLDLTAEDETVYAQRRLPRRTYVSKSFPITQPHSQDRGQPARFVHKVFDADEATELNLDGDQWVIFETAQGRIQIKLLVAREAGAVKELWIQKVPTDGSPGKLKTLMNLKREAAGVLVELVRNLDLIPVEGETSVRVDDALVRDLFADPASLVQVYHRDPNRFRQLISDDEAARDVVAIAYRRAQVERFRALLNDPDVFAQERAQQTGRGTEHVWQNFFEENPWILGVTLAGQLHTSWDSEKLRQAVTGRSVKGVGKEADGLLRSAGRVRSMVFAEFKNHDSALLHKEYRGGCWSPSEHLAGGVAQAQGTLHRAVEEIGDRLAEQAADGSDSGEFTYLIRPRSYLIIGQLQELIGQRGGDHHDKIRSFELYRRHLDEPEVITYDELLARAEWFVDTAAQSDVTIRG
jgi:antiviral defense system Shedu protein SduA